MNYKQINTNAQQHTASTRNKRQAISQHNKKTYKTIQASTHTNKCHITTKANATSDNGKQIKQQQFKNKTNSKIMIKTQKHTNKASTDKEQPQQRNTT